MPCDTTTSTRMSDLLQPKFVSGCIRRVRGKRYPRRPRGIRNTDSMPRAGSLISAATSTFAANDRSFGSLGVWNVLATPSRAIAAELGASIPVRPIEMCPESAAKKPETMFRIVFPYLIRWDQLIREQNWRQFEGHVVYATTPPNRRLALSTRSASSPGPENSSFAR